MEFTEVFARGVEGVDPLSPNEAACFRFTIFQIFKVAEDMHFQHDEGILDAARWKGWRWVFEPPSTFKRVGALLEPRTP
jgi:hypothetical protein